MPMGESETSPTKSGPQQNWWGSLRSPHPTITRVPHLEPEEPIFLTRCCMANNASDTLIDPTVNDNTVAKPATVLSLYPFVVKGFMSDADYRLTV